jgi:hypothetical protein
MLVAIGLLVILAVTAFAFYRFYGLNSDEMTKQEGHPGIPALPPFANQNFDVSIFPPIVTLPEGNGSITVQVELRATNLTHEETLLLKTNSSIPGYSASFNLTSVRLSPGQSIGVDLTVTIPAGVQNGAYPLSVVARGASTLGGAWLVIMIGTSNTAAPP